MADRRRSAWALAAVIVHYLTTIQPHAQQELARWRRRALAIPDPRLRAHVLRIAELLLTEAAIDKLRRTLDLYRRDPCGTAQRQRRGPQPAQRSA